MMTLADIECWVRGGESETLELKGTTGERREAARTICAMLNHRGGRVIFGVEPDGRLIGQMVSDRTVEEVAQELGEIDPPVFPSIERVDFAEGRQLLTIGFSPTRYVPPQRVAQNVTERQQRVLLCLSRSADGLALREIRKGLGEEIAEWELKNELAALKHLGLVQTKGYARGARWILS